MTIRTNNVNSLLLSVYKSQSGLIWRFAYRPGYKTDIQFELCPTANTEPFAATAAASTWSTI